MNAGAASDWHSLAELAAMKLPGLPHTRQGLVQRAQEGGWASCHGVDGSPLARKRAGRGGGLEYHVAILPDAARQACEIARPIDALAAQAGAEPQPAAPAEPIAAEAAWRRFERSSTKVRQRAQDALAIVQAVEALVAAGLRKTAAIGEAARTFGKPPSTIHRYFALIAGVADADRLPYLAPSYTGGGKPAEIDDADWTALLSDFLRLERPSFESCYRRVSALAAAAGRTLPASKTLLRRLEATVEPAVVTARREGIDAHRRHLPPQERSVTHLRALELVNIDGHTCDVRVRFLDGTIGRPVLIAIQDVMSRKFLAWRYAASEDAVTARLCFADLFRKHGIPEGLLADNGRAFACKWLTGQVPTRFRFKVKEDEPIGLMKMLGIAVHWALPYRGSSKPIERGFRDFCDAIARHPAFAGAYTGNNALNKPDNYGARAVDWAEFVRVWDAGIAEHNARPGRGTETARGVESFDQVFKRVRDTHPIQEATEAHLRLALMTGQQVRADRKTGAVRVLGNRYWSNELREAAGELVTVRFDPEDATQPVHVYAGERLVGVAAPIELTGFTDAAAARQRAKLEADHRKATRAAAAALGLLEADQLAQQYAALIPSYEDETPAAPKVVRPVRVRANAAPQAAAAAIEPDFTDDFMAGVERRLKLVE